ncbi:aspartic proteinase CDR1-like [Impatiens glandulifera]|uniref:aspartic proteinase CDR1-like n=1 Tax=Impatiens glandulifera TaxID=253017 RepID=UPI001FB16B05|nr:aspartic proteinase CDR1-like [Impatiens glandulifera]
MTNISFYHATLALYILLQLSATSPADALRGFTTSFIHRDSPASPFYDPSLSQADRTTGAIRRSISRLSRFKSALNLPNNDVKQTEDVNSKIVWASGDYLMEFYVGTPPFKQLAIADTGSDITWTQCLPCENCFKQDQPIFNSENSSTFRPLTCGSSLCQALGDSNACKETNGTCQYQLGYGDFSSSVGVLAMETYTIGGTSIPKLAYGCSHESQGTFQPDTAGIVGLGGGSFSLIGQLGKSIAGKFSYCLASYHKNRVSQKSSNISFGSNAIVSGSGVVTTSLVSKSPKTFYYLTLEALSVGGDNKTRFPFKGVNAVEKGNIIIDSGTTLTILPSNMYQSLEDSMKRAIRADPVQDPQGLLNLCYKNVEGFTAPTITAHFAGGADLVLPDTSTFVLNGDLLCLAIVPNDGVAIYGNLSQVDFLIGYDLENRTVSFKPTDCSKE